MDQIVKVFGQLGADETVFHQFGIFFVVFIVLKFVFFNKLQFVIEIRENKTTKLDKSANEKFQKAEQLHKDYSARVREVQSKSQGTLARLNSKALEQQKTILKETESTVDLQVEKKREEVEKEIDTKREAIMDQIPTISTEFVKKMTT